VAEKIAETERSYAVIELADLERLSEIAHSDLEQYIANDSERRAEFSNKKLCVTLCQGAALHYLDKVTGVKDFDVFTFFAADAGTDFPPRRRTCHDFGPSKFGHAPGDLNYAGRRVDVMGRSIAHDMGASPLESLLNYLRMKPTGTAWHLARKAVVIIDPIGRRGEVIWPQL
jgi:hypothetical protein